MIRALPFTPVLFLALVACGGTSSSLSSNLDGSAPGDDGGGPATDATVPDGAASGDDGGPTSEASTPEDAGGEGGIDAGSCSALATRKECVTCCDKALPGGASAFAVAVYACACQPDICGPVDGGAGAEAGADAGDLGIGACTPTCSTKAAPDPACQRCLATALGTQANPGECRASVTSACASSVPCERYAACTGACPP